MVKMHSAAVQRDEYVDKEMDKHHERLARHRHNLETMRGWISVLKEENFEKRALIDSMADKLCHCRASPRLVGSGTWEEPFAMDDELKYEGSPNSYHSAPLSTPPSKAPIPIPYPGTSVLRDSDEENRQPACCSASVPVWAPLMPIGEVDEEAEPTLLFPIVEDVPRVVVCQTCRRSKPFKTDPHPYRMALGNRQQQRARDAKLFIQVCGEEKLPYNHHLGDQKQWRRCRS